MAKSGRTENLLDVLTKYVIWGFWRLGLNRLISHKRSGNNRVIKFLRSPAVIYNLLKFRISYEYPFFSHSYGGITAITRSEIRLVIPVVPKGL